MNELLVSFEEVSIIVPQIAENIDKKQFDSYLLNVMRTRYRELIGDERYIDLITNPATPENIELLQGNGVEFYGCREWIAYMVLIAYIQGQSSVKVTRAGIVKKSLDYSEHAEPNEKKELTDHLSVQANYYKAQILAYLGNCKTSGLPFSMQVISQPAKSYFPRNGFPKY
jgi:hypothetical protein